MRWTGANKANETYLALVCANEADPSRMQKVEAKKLERAQGQLAELKCVEAGVRAIVVDAL